MKELVWSLGLFMALGNASAQVTSYPSQNVCTQYVRTVASGYIKLADFEIFDQNQNPIYLTLRYNKNEYIWYVQLPTVGYCISPKDRAVFTFEGGQQYAAKMLENVNCKGSVTYDLADRDNQALLRAFLTKKLTLFRFTSDYKNLVSIIPPSTGTIISEVFGCMKL